MGKALDDLDMAKGLEGNLEDMALVAAELVG